MPNVAHSHAIARRYLEIIQDLIVIGLILMLFLGMSIKLAHLAVLMFQGIDFSLMMADLLFLLVLLELFRLLVLYLEEHHISVPVMVEVGLVSTLREVIVRGALHIEWPSLLVLSVFIATLGVVLRYSGIQRRRPPPVSGE